MYLQGGNAIGATGLGACVVPRNVVIRRLICTDADLVAIGGVLGLGRDPVIREVRTAIEDAARRCVVLIERAESQLRRPRATGLAGDAMRARFHDAFGRPPEFVPTWRPAGQTWDIGAVVRERLRCAAKIMSEGDIEFVAWGPGSCPFAVAWTPGTWAVVQPGRYRICLGQRFWHASRERDAEGMATTLLHECLHIYFGTIRHRLEVWPFNRAACYERYVLVVNGMPIPDAVNIPCPSGAPVAAATRGAPRATVAGLGDPTQQVQDALKAIGAVLALNPMGGYVKGSSARSQLDARFQSVDDCIALEVAEQLQNGQTGVPRLFRLRLHRVTRAAMILILATKAQACQEREKKRLQQRQRALDAIRKELCQNASATELAVDEVCRKTDESSDVCRTLRSDLKRAKEQIRAAGATCAPAQ